jgi:PKD repeat protein
MLKTQIHNAMKTIVYISVLLTFLMFSCELSPDAHFYIDNVNPEVGEEVYFNNESDFAVEFEWDFGDGFISHEPDPVHVFTGTGSFEVVLTAYSGKGVYDQAAITINVMIPTLLEVEVLEYYDEYSVPDASVRLYSTLPDWENEEDREAEGYTDEDGIVVFSHLGPYVYYADVWETNHDNYALKAEDIGFIRTPEIMPHKINRFIAYVDIVDHGKGDRTDDKTYILRKFERKAADKEQSLSITSTDNWQKLYDRSIKMK